MSTDERPESLAAQAAAWVPPWERRPAAPDPGYAAAVRAAASDDDPGLDDEPDLHADPDVEGYLDPASPQAQASADADTDADDRAGDDDGGTGADVPVELPPLPGEATGPATVDAPQPMDGDEFDPTDVDPDEPDVVAPDLPHPDEEPVDVPAGGGVPVDAPAPADGDDAGSVFDTAADDDVSDDDEIDLPAVGAPAGPTRPRVRRSRRRGVGPGR